MSSLAELIARTPYTAYTYAYPHKTAYRPLETPIPLQTLWETERKDALFLYLHVPFCEMRCGFCNLFTTVNPADEFADSYLATLRRQAHRVREAIGPASYARLAIGGGTPTYLGPGALHALFNLVEDLFGVDPGAIPVSCETSPATAQPERLQVLREWGVDRVSIGVQSFVEAEVEAALARIRHLGFPILNIDLIYGLPGQTVASWLDSVRAALRFQPEELYLYPLYVRPLTGLGRRGVAGEDIRLSCYHAGRALLLEAGYHQVSMRMFRAPSAPAQEGPVYCCQEDGMVGLGCGARSYTRGLHYSGEYAVGAAGVKEILHAYIARPDTALDHAEYGFLLDGEDQRRRYLIQSLLQEEGLRIAAYQARFGGDPWQDLPQLRELEALELAVYEDETLRLNEHGLAYSDTIGPWLYSTRVNESMCAYAPR